MLLQMSLPSLLLLLFFLSFLLLLVLLLLLLLLLRLLLLLAVGWRCLSAASSRLLLGAAPRLQLLLGCFVASHKGGRLV